MTLYVNNNKAALTSTIEEKGLKAYDLVWIEGRVLPGVIQ